MEGVTAGLVCGRAEFLEKLEGYLEPALEGRRRESYSGGAKAKHDAAAAERALAITARSMLESMGIDGRR